MVAMALAAPNTAEGVTVLPLRAVDLLPALSADPPCPALGQPDLALAMVRNGHLLSCDLVPSLAAEQHNSRGLARLIATGQLSEAEMLLAAASHFGATRVDPLMAPPNPLLVDGFGARNCLRLGLLPWRQAGAVTVVATSRPEEFAQHRAALEASLGPVSMALAPFASIERAVLRLRGPRLAHIAATRVTAQESCRGWDGQGRKLAIRALALFCGIGLLLAPGLIAFALLGLAVLALASSTALKLAAFFAARRHRSPLSPLPPMAALPPVSIIVALYKESDIAPRLVRRLSRLDYPRDLMEVLLVVEEDDHPTREALAIAALPAWMRVVVAPDGPVRTKPRALNIALDHCRGTIIGVYDAEDAPEPDQIHKVVRQFHHAPANVACLQGVLDYYNPLSNWLSRCFTLEYAGWFRLMLPGIARLGLAVPLGGTTLFFRRKALEDLGGWDAHNVTEDADLGLRLFRRGHRTELLDSITREEANCSGIRAWVKQRSRWSKGYMMTWLVHMRAPRQLWRQTGPWAFMGVQIMILGSCLQALLAPLIWSFWLLSLGLPHPVVLPPLAMLAMIGLFLVALALDLALALLALRQSGHRISRLWCLALPCYFPLATLAAWKALWEVATRPYYWDKTLHGIFDHAEAATGERALKRQTAWRRALGSKAARAT